MKLKAEIATAFADTQLQSYIRQAEEFRSSFEQAPVGIALLSGEGAWLYANRTLCEMTGYTEKELLAPDHSSMHPDDMPKTRELIEKMVRGSIATGRLEKHIIRNGNGLHLLVNVAALPRDQNGEAHGYVARMVDIRKLSMADEALRESNALFRGLLDSAPDAMVIVNEEGRIELINSQTETLFGYTKGELLGEKMEVLVPHRFRRGHVSHRTGYSGAPQVRAIGSALRPGPGLLEMDCVTRRQDGVLIAELELLDGAYSLEPVDLDAHIRGPLAHGVISKIYKGE